MPTFTCAVVKGYLHVGTAFISKLVHDFTKIQLYLKRLTLIKLNPLDVMGVFFFTFCKQEDVIAFLCLSTHSPKIEQ